MPDIPDVTEEQIRTHLDELADLAVVRRALGDTDSAQKLSDSANIIRSLQARLALFKPSEPMTQGRLYYVVDLAARVVIQYNNQTDVARLCHENKSTISAAVNGERTVSLGRYFITRSRDRADQLMADHPAPLTRPRRISHVDVETTTGALVKRYDSVRAFAMDYDLNVSTAYALIRRYPGGTPGEIYGYPDRRVRTTYRT